MNTRNGWSGMKNQPCGFGHPSGLLFFLQRFRGEQITYQYDASISPSLQAEILLGVPAMEGFQQLLADGSGNWQIDLSIRNCHTGNFIARGTLPEETITFDDTDWMEREQ